VVLSPTSLSHHVTILHPQIFGATRGSERYTFSFRFRQWRVTDVWTRPLYYLDFGSGQTFPQNVVYNASGCCPAGWSTSSSSLAVSATFPYSKRCLRFFEEAVTYAAAEAACVNSGGRLATITSYDENLFVSRLAAGRAAWIGLNDRAVEGTWAWVDPLIPSRFMSWSSDPTNNGDRDCVQINHGVQGRWGFLLCSSHRPYVCSTDAPNDDAFGGVATNLGCGQRVSNLSLRSDQDIFGRYTLGRGSPGSVFLPDFPEAAGGRTWTFSADEDGSGGMLTVAAQGPGIPQRLLLTTEVATCPATGCRSPPPPPPPPPPERQFFPWTSVETWSGTRAHPGNPMNVLRQVAGPKGAVEYVVISAQEWALNVPSANDNVWIPPWRKVSCRTCSTIFLSSYTHSN
jgi:hypothetical protein